MSGVEVAPSATAECLHANSDRGAALPGDDLLALAAGIQVIDGEFEARRPDATEPWVVLRAVDGSSWDVVSDDLGVLDDYRRSFPDAAPLP
jgi:hypothetical protein